MMDFFGTRNSLLLSATILLPIACTSPSPKTTRMIKSINKVGTGSGSSSNAGPKTSREGIVAPTKVEAYSEKDAFKRFNLIMDQVEGKDSCGVAEHNREIRLKTKTEYLHSINYAFGTDFDLDHLDFAEMPAQTAEAGFKHLRNFNLMSKEKMEGFYQTAEYLSMNEDVVKSIKKALNCGDGGEKCFQKWAEKTLPVFWRANLSSDELDKEYDLFKGFGGDEKAIEPYMTRVLISPRFLYNTRIGGGSGSTLTSWEIASILSFSLWGGKLDSDLVEAASDEKLQEKKDIAKMVSRMIEDEKFYDGLESFTYSWMNLDFLKERTIHITENTAMTEDEKKPLFKETAAFLLHLIRNDEDSIENIFNSDFTFLPKELHTPFILNEDSSSDGPVKGMPKGFEKSFFPDKRRGIISQPSVLVSISNDTRTNISRRGKQLMENFLCEGLPLPANSDDKIANAVFDDDIPRIETLHALTSRGKCGECHAKINGIGGALEALSENGLPRKLDQNEKPTNGAGSVTFDEKKVEVTGVQELAEAISNSPRAGACISLKLFRLLYGRLETKADTCTIASAYKNAQKDKGKFQDILTNLLTDPSMINLNQQ